MTLTLVFTDFLQRVQTSEGMTQLEASLARLLAAQHVRWKTPQQNIVQLLPTSG